MVLLYTLGFTGKTAMEFFTLLEENNIKILIDVRLKNNSQLSGFTKKTHLKYFLKVITNIEYEHVLELAPTKELLDSCKKNKEWKKYHEAFLNLIKSRKIEDLERDKFDGACLLCSEKSHLHCHRKIVSDYLEEKWNLEPTIHL